MGKRERREERARGLTRRRRRHTILGTLAGTAAAFLMGAGAWYAIGQRSEVVPVTYKGGPRLEVDRDTIDFGPRRFEQWVKATFILRNVGDQPLRLAANPPVLVSEGC
jgi:hypothetical protein